MNPRQLLGEGLIRVLAHCELSWAPRVKNDPIVLLAGRSQGNACGFDWNRSGLWVPYLHRCNAAKNRQGNLTIGALNRHNAQVGTLVDYLTVSTLASLT